MKPQEDPILEVYADADFSGNWNRKTAQYDSSTAKSRTGFIIYFAKCTIMWTSKLQTQIALADRSLGRASAFNILRKWSIF